MKTRFEVSGSSGVVYVVETVADGREVTITCDCDAGRNGMACRHRLAVLSGDASAIVSSNKRELANVTALLPGTKLLAQLSKVAQAEEAADDAKRELSKAKKELSRLMDGR